MSYLKPKLKKKIPNLKRSKGKLKIYLMKTKHCKRLLVILKKIKKTKRKL